MKQKDLFQLEDNSKPGISSNEILNNQGAEKSIPGSPIGILDEEDLRIVRLIKEMPDLQPPSNLITSIMQSIQPKKLPWWRQIYQWAGSPKSITFIPLRIAPMAIFFVAGFIFISLLVFKQKDSQYFQTPEQHRLPVVFSLRLPEAKSISIIGTFNSWKGPGYEMQMDKGLNAWSLTLWLPEGRYEYGFLVDGQKVISDPKSLLYQNDGFGSRNSVLILRMKNGEDA